MLSRVDEQDTGTIRTLISRLLALQTTLFLDQTTPIIGNHVMSFEEVSNLRSQRLALPKLYIITGIRLVRSQYILLLFQRRVVPLCSPGEDAVT